jgi:hypothetical protein
MPPFAGDVILVPLARFAPVMGSRGPKQHHLSRLFFAAQRRLRLTLTGPAIGEMVIVVHLEPHDLRLAHCGSVMWCPPVGCHNSPAS